MRVYVHIRTHIYCMCAVVRVYTYPFLADPIMRTEANLDI